LKLPAARLGRTTGNAQARAFAMVAGRWDICKPLLRGKNESIKKLPVIMNTGSFFFDEFLKPRA
jgi:hypothetical protein